MDLAGVASKASDQFDGVNLMPYLTKKRSDIPHESFKWRFTISAGIFEDHWKLIQLPDRLPMLFNLQNDISEQNDVALENVELTKKLMKKIGRLELITSSPFVSGRGRMEGKTAGSV
ncbi:hypothetical protein [Algoriphagus boritolerans]|uniref:hypothetical protein n=1 Tax=Algoriphagus boritolerans TaxID=308111 RepID=UPI002FCE5D7B